MKSQAKQLKRSQGRSIFSISALVRCGRIFPTFFKQWQVQYNESLLVSIYYQDTLRYQEEVRFGRSFAQVAEQEPVLYVNSLLNIGLGLNLASFAETYKIGTGTNWKITLKKGEMKMNQSKFTVKHIVAIGIGAAVFFVLKRFVTIPTGFQIQISPQPILSWRY